MLISGAESERGYEDWAARYRCTWCEVETCETMPGQYLLILDEDLRLDVTPACEAGAALADAAIVIVGSLRENMPRPVR